MSSHEGCEVDLLKWTTYFCGICLFFSLQVAEEPGKWAAAGVVTVQNSDCWPASRLAEVSQGWCRHHDGCRYRRVFMASHLVRAWGAYDGLQMCAYVILKSTHKHGHTHIPVPLHEHAYTHTWTHTHACTHSHMHTRAHVHTHTHAWNLTRNQWHTTASTNAHRQDIQSPEEKR